MKSVKTLSHVTYYKTYSLSLTRAISESGWLSRVAVIEVDNAMESFCNMTFATSERHVDNRISRISRDACDGIFFGVIGNLGNVNCHIRPLISEKF